MITPIRLLIAGVDRAKAATFNRPMVDALTGSGYAADGSDFAGWAKTSHVHAIGDTTGLQAALDAKAAVGLSYTKAEGDARFAPIAHTHAANTLTGTVLSSGVVTSSLTGVGILAAPHMTSPVVDSGGMAPTDDTVQPLGGAAKRWSNVYAVLGTFATAVTIGGDPGGSEKLRVNGGARFNGATVVAAGGLTVTAGGLTVSAGDITTGSGVRFLSPNDASGMQLGISGVGIAITVASSRLVTFSSGITVNSGAITAGNGIAVNSGNLMISTGLASISAGIASFVGLNMGPTLSGSGSQYGQWNGAIFGSDATATGIVYYSAPQTAAASFTLASAYGFYAKDFTLGAGSSITTQYGVYVAAQTKGATNYALFTAGTTPSQFGGPVGFNGTTPPAKPALPAAATDATTNLALTNAIRTALINYGLAA